MDDYMLDGLELSADGYDVSNLLSADPELRRRGFRLEYFMRPPLHVTLRFQAEVELCRLDVELWPWAAEQARRSRRLEVLVCETHGEHFRLVSRVDLQDQLQVCVVHPAFRAAPASCGAPPAAPAQPTHFWGSVCLASVGQLRISVPYSGPAAALGIRKLCVWASPSRRCSAAQLRALRDADLKASAPSPAAPAAPDPPRPTQTPPPVPQEFLDPLTQELMALPMILPCGVVLDLSSLEEYERREASWGRVPNDPFTGVPFTPSSKPLPNPLLKTRIDRLLLRTANLTDQPQPSRLTLEHKPGSESSPGSRTDSHVDNSPNCSRIQSASITDSGRDSNKTNTTPKHSTIRSGSTPGSSADSNNVDNSPKCFKIQSRSITGTNSINASPKRSRIQSGSTPSSSRDSNSINASPNCSRIHSGSITDSSRDSTERSRVRSDCDSDSECGATQGRVSAKRKFDSSFPSSSGDPDHMGNTHETPADGHAQRLSLSLDAALSAALRGLPTFTTDMDRTSAGPQRCVFCSRTLSVYSRGVVCYALRCSHLTCGPCVREKRASHTLQIRCPVCGATAAPADVTRVHH